MGLVKTSDIKPGDKFNIMGMEMFVKNIRYIDNMIHFTFENIRTVINPPQTVAVVNVTFNNVTWVSTIQ